jgi:hypothetical protein
MKRRREEWEREKERVERHFFFFFFSIPFFLKGRQIQELAWGKRKT